MLLNNPQLRFEEIYPIYQSSFPIEERRTKQGQKDTLKNPDYKLRIKEEEGEIVAFLGYWDLPNCLFIEHLATTAACRSKGYGKELVLEVLHQTKKPVFLEIEPVEESEPMTKKRAQFYERLNFFANSFPYLQMPLKQGDDPIPLWIMSYQGPITEEEFLPYKKEIYRLAYQCSCEISVK